MISVTRLRDFLVPALYVFFALALQVQTSLFQTDHYDGLRIGLADPLLPLLALFIFSSVLLKKSVWPAWRPPFSYGFLFLLSIVLTLALLHGYVVYRDWYRWALVNKYAGWFVLMAYIGAGAWLSSNYPDKISVWFIRPFVCIFILISIVAAVVMILQGLCGNQTQNCVQVTQFFQLKGLMDNRNAYGLLLDLAALLITLFSYRHEGFLPRWMLPLLWLSAPTLILLNGSRILWLTFPLLFFICLIHDSRKTLRVIVPCLLIGAIAFAVIGAPKQKQMIQRRLSSIAMPLNPPNANGLKQNHGALNGAMHDRGDNVRVYTYKTGFEVWQAHKLIGGGLGSTMREQHVAPNDRPYVIDDTPLWILSEMGLAGFAIFAISFGAIMFALKQSFDLNKDTMQGTIVLCTIYIIILFCVFSLVHELLYTRFLWFFLGLTLAVPKRHPAV